MSVSTDPRYRTLAGTALAAMGVPSSGPIVAAIVSQWQCEQPASAWPPVHNNPGFVTVGALASVGVKAAYAQSSPGAGFLAAFPSPSAGATAYGQLIGRGNRYKPVVAAARAKDGAAYLKAITDAGYGTRYSCCIGAYKALGGTVPPGGADPSAPAPPKSDPGAVVEAVYTVALASSCEQVDIIVPDGPLNVSAYPLPQLAIAEFVASSKGTAGVPCVACKTGFNLGVVSTTPVMTAIGGWTDPSSLPAGTPNACIKDGLKPGDSIQTGPVGDLVGAWVGPLVAGIGDVFRQGAFLLAILGVVVLGLYLVATSSDPVAA